MRDSGLPGYLLRSVWPPNPCLQLLLYPPLSVTLCICFWEREWGQTLSPNVWLEWHHNSFLTTPHPPRWLLRWQNHDVVQAPARQLPPSLVSWEAHSWPLGQPGGELMAVTSLWVFDSFRSCWNVLWPGPCGMFSLADSNLFSHFAVGKLSQGVQSLRAVLDRWETSN